MSDSEQRIIVVTGGSRGIGRALCLAFSDRKSRVFFNYAASDSAARETEHRAAEKGGYAQGVRADVSTEEDVAGFVKHVLDVAGRIDVLVNNAGVTRDGLLVRMKESDWSEVIDTNLKGAFFCMKAVAKPMMKQRYGRIINMTSVVGVSGNPGQANYVASKAGIIGLTKAAAKELAGRGITVNAVAPGFVETEMTRELPEKARQAMIEQIPVGRAAVPEDIAPVVVFLASAEASYITGQVIQVNGGMYM
ncbi:MAG: 3-oxoacyl-[acyl-carrier-protein] reductase [Desulfobacterales bacterium]